MKFNQFDFAAEVQKATKALHPSIAPDPAAALRAVVAAYALDLRNGTQHSTPMMAALEGAKRAL